MRQINWWAMLPQLVLMVGTMTLLEYGLGIEGGALIGAMAFIAIVFLLQWMIPHHHRQGLALIRQNNFTEAFLCFQESYDYFTKNAWMDNYRAFVIFSVSRISYKEMALLNMAYCVLQMKEVEKAKKLYERTLEEYPNSEMAKIAIDFLNEKADEKQNEEVIEEGN